MDSRRWQDFLEHAALSDIGLRRGNNQDSYGLQMAGNEEQWQRRGHLFLVADGMGAHAAGELASKLAVDTVTLSYFKVPDSNAPDALRQSVVAANHKIHTTGEENIDFKGMGTTCSALLVLPQGAVAAQVGDSRVYRLRGNRLEQLSRDHSLVWEMMVNSRLAEHELPAYVPKNIITRSLGPSADVQVDLEGPFPLAVGDKFLVCSDGLSGQVTDDELGVVMGVLPPQEASRALIDLANLRGGPDNITLIIVHINADSGSSGDDASAGGLGTGGFLTLAGSALLALGGGIAGFMFNQAAYALAVLGVVGVVLSLINSSRKNARSAANSLSQTPLGGGPYRAMVCPANAEIFERFSKLIDPVCKTARDNKWAMRWSDFDTMLSAAKSALGQQQYAVAIREQLRAITFLMQEIRDQQNRS